MDTPPKVWKPNSGWEKILEMNRKRDEAAAIRKKKEEAYRYMVGSVRELQRKRMASGLTKRGYARPQSPPSPLL